MNKSEFEQIINDIEEQRNACKDTLSHYFKSNKKIDEMSVKSLNHTIAMCRVSLSKMDKFVQIDMYHIIGMGNMNAAQISKFAKVSKELTSYRPYVKLFAAMNPAKVPGNIKDSSYTLSSGIKLSKKN